MRRDPQGLRATARRTQIVRPPARSHLLHPEARHQLTKLRGIARNFALKVALVRVHELGFDAMQLVPQEPLKDLCIAGG